MASRIFTNASSSVAPCDQHPGSPGQETLYPSSVRIRATGYFIFFNLGLWPLGVVLVFELLSGFLAIECPIDRDAISVGSPVPGAGFRPENPDLAESALPQTLLGKEADLQFRLIQPTSVYRRVVN